MSKMTRQMKRLWEIQQLDRSIRRLRTKLDQLESRDRLAKLDKALAAARRQLDKDQQAAEQLLKQLRRKELALKELDAEIAAGEKELYTSGQGPRELRALQNRLEALHTRKTDLEEEILRLMEQQEEQAARQQQHERILQAIESEHKTAQDNLAKEEAPLLAEIEELTYRKAEIEATVDQEWLSHYENMVSRRGTDVVALLENGICQGCNMAVPKRLQEQAAGATSTPVCCENCGRMLYVPM